MTSELGGAGGGGHFSFQPSSLLPPAATEHHATPRRAVAGCRGDSAAVSALQKVGRMCEQSLPFPPRRRADAQRGSPQASGEVGGCPQRGGEVS